MAGEAITTGMAKAIEKGVSRALGSKDAAKDTRPVALPGGGRATVAEVARMAKDSVGRFLETKGMHDPLTVRAAQDGSGHDYLAAMASAYRHAATHAEIIDSEDLAEALRGRGDDLAARAVAAFRRTVAEQGGISAGAEGLARADMAAFAETVPQQVHREAEVVPLRASNEDGKEREMEHKPLYRIRDIIEMRQAVFAGADISATEQAMGVTRHMLSQIKGDGMVKAAIDAAAQSGQLDRIAKALTPVTYRTMTAYGDGPAVRPSVLVDLVKQGRHADLKACLAHLPEGVMPHHHGEGAVRDGIPAMTLAHIAADFPNGGRAIVALKAAGHDMSVVNGRKDTPMASAVKMGFEALGEFTDSLDGIRNRETEFSHALSAFAACTDGFEDEVSEGVAITFTHLCPVEGERDDKTMNAARLGVVALATKGDPEEIASDIVAKSAEAGQSGSARLEAAAEGIAKAWVLAARTHNLLRPSHEPDAEAVEGLRNAYATLKGVGTREAALAVKGIEEVARSYPDRASLVLGVATDRAERKTRVKAMDTVRGVIHAEEGQKQPQRTKPSQGRGWS